MAANEHGGEQPLFGRFSREECGLPPPPAGNRRLRFVLRAVLLLAIMWAAGWLGGQLSVRHRELQNAQLPARVRAAGPEDVPGLIAVGKFYAAALPERPAMRRNLAVAALVAAENAPRRMGYFGNIARLLDGAAAGGDPLTAFFTELTASGVYAELGEYERAFAALARAETALAAFPDDDLARSHRLLLVNAQAYYLATAPAGAGRNPEKALHLAQLMMTSRDVLPGGASASGSAALLDTLASAWAAAGEFARAAETQTCALGLAESQGLDVYVRHFDEFRRGTDNGE